MNGLILPVPKLGILNPPLPDASGERWESRALRDCRLEARRVTGTRRDFTVHSCKQRKSCGGEMTCPRSCSQLVVKLGLALGKCAGQAGKGTGTGGTVWSWYVRTHWCLGLGDRISKPSTGAA